MLSCRAFSGTSGNVREYFCTEPRGVPDFSIAINCTTKDSPVCGHRNRGRTGVPGNNAGERGGIIVLPEGKTQQVE